MPLEKTVDAVWTGAAADPPRTLSYFKTSWGRENEGAVIERKKDGKARVEPQLGRERVAAAGVHASLSASVLACTAPDVQFEACQGAGSRVHVDPSKMPS